MRQLALYVIVAMALALFMGKWLEVLRNRRVFRDSMRRAAEKHQENK